MAGNHPCVAVSDHVQFYAEIKPQLAIANVTVGFSTNEVEHVEVGKHEIQLFGRDYRYLCSLELSDVTFQPMSCHGLNWSPSDGLSFRIQLANYHSDIYSFSESQTSLQDDTINLLRSPTLVMACRRCHNQIGTRKGFAKVLPLPSDGWSEFSDGAFCHEHDHGEECDSKAGHAENLQNNASCLVGTYFALISIESLFSNAVKLEKDILMCSKCRNRLGITSSSSFFKKFFDKNTKQGNIVQLFLFSVSMAQSTLTPSCTEIEDNMEHWLAKFLQWQASAASSFRILIEEKKGTVPSQPYILVWLMDSKGLVCHGKISPSQKIKPQPFIKIMYKDCLQKNLEEAKTWRHDFSVLHLALPDQLCALLLKHLISNTKTMPKSQQLVNGFFVSYLLLPG